MHIYQNNLSELTESELQKVICDAENELRLRKLKFREQGIIKIQEIANLIGVEVKIKQIKNKKTKNTIRFRDPSYPENTWTGRGPIPRWLNSYLNNGYSLDIFKIEQ